MGPLKVFLNLEISRFVCLYIISEFAACKDSFASQQGVLFWLGCVFPPLKKEKKIVPTQIILAA